MGETVEKTYQFLENFEKWLIGTGLSDQMAQLTKVAISLFVIIALSVAVNYIAKHFIVVWLNRIAKRTPSNWNTFMIKRKVLHKLSHLAGFSHSVYHRHCALRFQPQSNYSH